jgi:hypothetical protein
MIFRTTDLSNGVSIVSNGTNLTRITFANTGIYNLQFSSQFSNSDNAEQDVTIWLRLNGSDVAGSAGFVSIPQKHGAISGHTITSWNYLLDVAAGQYYELYWSTTDHTKVQMQFYPAGSPPPSVASVILTISQQAGILAGTGITAMNSLTGAAQTLVTGSAGTDFAISSAGTSHTFNLPTASAANRGLLSSADWSNFNSKIGVSKSFMGTLIGFTMTAGQTVYGNFNYNAINTNELARIFVVPYACTISNFYVRLFTSQPATGSIVYTVRKNQVDTAVVVTIAAGSAANTEANSGVTSATFAAGDDMTFKAVNNATTTSANTHNFSILVEI